MITVEKLVDCSVWTGKWPFRHLRYGNMDTLKKKLVSENVAKAFIAPIDGILEQDPKRANKELLDTLDDSFFSPVLIIDMSYKNWQENMELALDDPKVEMVKLIPNYHMYELNDSDMEELVGLAKRKGIVISVQMMIEDPRTHYPLMKVPNVDCGDVIMTLSRFPDQVFILNNANLNNAKKILESLDNVFLDIASIERQDILELLHEEYSLERFVFSSHCPFYYPEAAIYKLKYANLDITEIEKVAYKNAEKIFTAKL